MLLILILALIINKKYFLVTNNLSSLKCLALPWDSFQTSQILEIQL